MKVYRDARHPEYLGQVILTAIDALRSVYGQPRAERTPVGLPPEVFYPDITLPPTGGECPRTDTPDGAAK